MRQTNTYQRQTGASFHVSEDPQAVVLHPRDDFFDNEKLRSLQFRALTYLSAGVPVHFRGPAGTGKTALAMQLAATLGQPSAIITGDSWLTSGDLVGEQGGTRTRQIVDRYVHSVQRTETETEAVWHDNVLTRAILNGYTLVYDEFTRSPPEANNPLLMALEERMLVVPGRGDQPRYMQAHPSFRAILTSNPSDYAGVSAPQDALIDRMITLDIEHQDRQTEIGIVVARTELDPEATAVVVDIVRAMRTCQTCGQTPSIRSALMIAKILKAAQLSISPRDPAFVQLCFDVLQSKSDATSMSAEETEAFNNALVAAIKTASVPRQISEEAKADEAISSLEESDGNTGADDATFEMKEAS